MIIKSLEDLRVHAKALEAADAVSAILDRPRRSRRPMQFLPFSADKVCGETLSYGINWRIVRRGFPR